jgi:L-asparaginase
MFKSILKAVFTLSIIICSNHIYAQQNLLPRVAILATGGTIAGSAQTATQSSYTPGVISIDQLISSVENLDKLANLTGIQICNISSQNMEERIWLSLHSTIDSLFSNNLVDGVVITHGTDTMEETAYFLNLTVKHNKPIILTGSMRPSTSLSADGPFNLYNAVALASSKIAHNKGVMIIMNDYIFSADDVIKSNTVNTNAFESPNYGPLGYIRDASPIFFRESHTIHTSASKFNIKGAKSLPKTEIVYSYAFSSNIGFNALIDGGIKGIVIAGVGHGNYNREYSQSIDKAIKKGVRVVRSSRIVKGGVDNAAEEYSNKIPVSYYKSPQKARILLMLSIYNGDNIETIQENFKKY